MTLFSQFTRFAGIGVFATATHVAAALFSEATLGFPPQIANLLGFLSAVSLSYLGQGRFTFDVALRHRVHGPRFLASALLGLALSSGLTLVIAVWMAAPFAIAMMVVAVAVPAATFVMCKFWVFNDPDAPVHKAPASHSQS